VREQGGVGGGRGCFFFFFFFFFFSDRWWEFRFFLFEFSCSLFFSLQLSIHSFTHPREPKRPTWKRHELLGEERRAGVGAAGQRVVRRGAGSLGDGACR